VVFAVLDGLVVDEDEAGDRLSPVVAAVADALRGGVRKKRLGDYELGWFDEVGVRRWSACVQVEVAGTGLVRQREEFG
jgi:hypothetical protein